jgi:hypothetical protein
MTTAFAAVLAAFIASGPSLPATPIHDANGAIRIEMAQSSVPRRPTVCTEQYAPVCGRIRNVTRTFSNACFARAAGAEIVADGPCSD